MRKIFYLLLLITGFSNAQVIIQTPSALAVCDNEPQDGIGIFDLTTKNAEILGTNDPNLYSIAYFETEIDAFNNENQIIAPNNFQSGFNTVFVRAWENVDNANYATTSLNLEVQSLQLVEPNDIVIFESTYDGFSTFDLTIRNEQIANGNLASYTFNYFTSLTDAQSNINSINNLSSYNNTSSYQTIFVRVTSIDPTACFSILELHLVVLDENLRPIIATPTAVNLCDVDNNGELFDLSTKNLEILALNDSSLYTVKYYNTLEEAEMNSLDLIASGIGGFLSQIIYVRVHENANVNNYSITSFNINLDSMPVANAVSNLFVYESPFDGFATFNLTTVNTTLLGNQTGLVSKFYLTQSDAINDVNQISDSTNFLNTINEQYIWVRVFNPSNLTCYQTTSITSFKLIVVDTNNVVNIPDANFKAVIIATGIDTNNDGNIQQIEALQLINLEIPYVTNFSNAILSYVGLNSFQNLNSFKVTSNNQNTIDFTNLPNLKKIEILGGSPMAFNNFVGTQSLEIVNIQQVTITSLDISSLSNLKTLVLKQVGLNSIDLSNNLQLKLLNIEINNLSSINISPLQNLETLNINNNNFSNIDIANNTNLLYFYCSFNQFVSLDLTQNTNLKMLECKYNNLNNLNLTQNTNLRALICDNNNLNSIDISQNINLLLIDCSNNNIANLDFSNNHQLSQIIGHNNSITNVIFSDDCPNLFTIELSNNNLTEIYVPQLAIYPDPYPYYSSLGLSNNPNLTFISLKSGIKQRLSLHIGMDNLLQYICVDDDDDVFISTNNQTNTYSIGSYCSFTPGGNFNTTSGSMTFDANNNGCDATDLPQSNIRIDINDGTNQGATFTNNSGNYNFYTQVGSFALTPNVENPTWFNFSPISATIPFADNNNNIATQNFCITANGVHPDLEIVIAPIVPARPGFDAVYQIVYKNKGNQTLSGSVNFQYNDANLDFVSSTTVPITQATGNLVWNYTNLLPFESRSVTVTLNVNSPMEIPAVNIDDVLNFTVTANPVIGDETISDNTFQLNQTVVGSYDPNDIICIEGDVVAPSYIGEYLHYVINFENTGTAPAENVVVKIEVNPNDFDINSLRILEASHNATIKITNNILEIIFQTIMLDTGGHGNVLLKVKSKENLVTNDIVTKNAKIYFDYNFPILTNDANTTFQTLSNSIPIKDLTIALYPNPTSSLLNIKAENRIKSVELYDVQGRIIQVDKVDSNEFLIDVSGYNSGVYFVKVITDFGSQIEKIVKD